MWLVQDFNLMPKGGLSDSSFTLKQSTFFSLLLLRLKHLPVQ